MLNERETIQSWAVFSSVHSQKNKKKERRWEPLEVPVISADCRLRWRTLVWRTRQRLYRMHDGDPHLQSPSPGSSSAREVRSGSVGVRENTKNWGQEENNQADAARDPTTPWRGVTPRYAPPPKRVVRKNPTCGRLVCVCVCVPSSGWAKGKKYTRTHQVPVLWGWWLRGCKMNEKASFQCSNSHRSRNWRVAAVFISHKTKRKRNNSSVQRPPARKKTAGLCHAMGLQRDDLGSGWVGGTEGGRENTSKELPLFLSLSLFHPLRTILRSHLVHPGREQMKEIEALVKRSSRRA